MNRSIDHSRFMNEAFIEAQKAEDRGEVPIGALFVQNGVVISRAGNRTIELNDSTAHAEILVLREAGQILRQYTFPDCIVYTTLWPCPMCENALIQAKVPVVVSGATSFKHIYENTFNPSRLTRVGPIMQNECRGIFIKWLKDSNHNHILEYEDL